MVEPSHIQITAASSNSDLVGNTFKMKKSGTESDGLHRKASLNAQFGIKHSKSSDSISIMSVESKLSILVRYVHFRRWRR